MRFPALLLTTGVLGACTDVPEGQAMAQTPEVPASPEVCRPTPSTDEPALGVSLQETAHALEDLRLINRAPYRRLRRAFVSEADRQLRTVEKAGGYCGLPKILDGRDDRLGTTLDGLVRDRQELLQGSTVDARWEVRLGRAECTPVKAVDMQEANALVTEWNHACAYVQGGWLQKPHRSAREILVARGALAEHTLGEDASVVEMAWRRKCTPMSSSGESLNESERDAFLASDLLYHDAQIGPVWTCPSPSLWGFERSEKDRTCGFFPECSLK